MKVDIFTEGTGTTSERKDIDKVGEFFKGSFLPVKSLSDRLNRHCHSEIHILSKNYGYVKGSDPVSSLSSNSEKNNEKFNQALKSASAKSDGLVILLTASQFEQTVVDQWDTIASNASENQIWCFGASEDSISQMNIKDLYDSGCKVETYRRVGVARIGSEVQDRIIDLVSQSSSGSKK